MNKLSNISNVLRKMLFIFAAISICTVTVFAQGGVQISGMITDNTGEPLPGATVNVKGTNVGTIADSNGKYSINNVPNRNAVLVFSFVGFTTQEISIGTRNEINVILLDGIMIDEVVVTALGMKRETRALSYAATEVKGDVLGKTSELNIMNSLSGKIAGVLITNQGTGIAGSSDVSIRGNTSISRGNNPLYVIDGVQMERASFTSSNRNFGDALNSLNPDDIESINVLKGASATALYGSQAANGVVLITTKKGNSRQGLGVSYSGSFGYDEYISPFKNRQKKYGQGIEGKKVIDTGNEWAYNAHQEWGAKYDGSEAYYPDGVTKIPWGYSYHSDPWDQFMRSGFTMNNSFAISSGGDIHNYRLSISDMRQQSPIPNSNANRQTMALSTTSKLGKKLTIESRLDFSTMDVKNRQNTQSYVWTLGHMPTMWDIKWAKGTTSKIGAQEDGRMLPWSTNEYYHNPYWAAYQNEANDTRDRINGMLSGKLDITDWLYLTGRIGMDLNVVKTRTVEAYGAAQFSNGTGSVSEFTNKTVRWNFDWSLNVKKAFGDFNLNAMFGGASTYSESNRDGVTGTVLTIPFYHQVTNGSVQSASVSYNKSGINSLHGMAELSYGNFVFLTVTGRNDWFSTLNPDNNSLFYPSVGLSYVFSQHFKMPDWMTFGKLRGSYAKTGGGASAYMTKFGYSLNALGYVGYPLSSLPSTIPKSDLMPFEVLDREIGIDLRFLNNRLTFDYAYYDKLTRNDIISVSPASSSGYSSATVNLGEMSNKGHEFSLTVVPVQNKSLKWELTAIYSFNKSKILNLGGYNEFNSGSYQAGTTVKQIIGKQYNTIQGYRQLIDPASGQPVWYWNNSYQIWFPQRTPDLVDLGIGTHPNIGSISTTISYKGITLSAMVDGQWGAKVYSYTEYDMTARGHTNRTIEFRETGIPVSGVYNAGTVAAPNYVPLEQDPNAAHITTIPYRANLFENYYRYAFGDQISSYNLFDASFAIMRQMSLSYAFPSSMLRNSPIKNLRLSLVGGNLFSIYNKMPNGHAATLPNNGYESNTMPISRSYTLNINFSF